MVMFTEEKLGSILDSVDLAGFTECVKGSLLRYAVAFTDNPQRTLKLLADQANYFNQFNERLNVGGRTSPTGTILIDIGTSFETLEEAMYIARMFSQDAIRDLVKHEDIPVNYNY